MSLKNGQLLPKVVFMLATFLQKNNHLKKENIIRQEGSWTEREKIKLHLTFGDYSILEKALTKEKYPYEVACLLKNTISDFTEPVCPYDVYEYHLFTKISIPRSKDEMMEFVVDLLNNRINSKKENPCINIDTILFLAEVFRIVGQNTE